MWAAFQLLVKKFRFLLLFHCIWKLVKKSLILNFTVAWMTSLSLPFTCTLRCYYVSNSQSRHIFQIFKHCGTFYHKFKSFYKSRDFQSALLNRKRTLQRTTDGYQDWLRSTVLWKGKDPLSPWWILMLDFDNYVPK